MLNRIIIAMFVCCLYTVTVTAGPGHSDDDKEHGDDHGHSQKHDDDDKHEHDDEAHSHDPITKNQADTKAQSVIKRLVNKGKIPKSWMAVKQPLSTEQKTFKNGPEWIITWKNTDVSEADKQTLYIFLSLAGEYIAANYTGN